MNLDNIFRVITCLLTTKAVVNNYGKFFNRILRIGHP
jgi:hypothetical protein